MKNNIESVEDKILKIAKKRFYKHKKRSEKLNIDGPKLHDYIDIFKESYKNGFFCYYCGKKLKFVSTHPFSDVPSVDHKIPLNMKGTNNKENLAICCYACNLIKGTMSSETFKNIIKSIDKETLDKMFKESFSGKFANKLERINIENESV